MATRLLLATAIVLAAVACGGGEIFIKLPTVEIDADCGDPNFIQDPNTVNTIIENAQNGNGTYISGNMTCTETAATSVIKCDCTYVVH